MGGGGGRWHVYTRSRFISLYSRREHNTVNQLCCCCSLSRIWLFVTPWAAAHQASVSFTISQSLLMPMESMTPSNHRILCHPFLLLPSILPSIRIFSNELVLHIRWEKYWNFSFSISPSNEYLGLISFRIDRLDLLVVQGSLRSLLQHHNLKAPILQCSAFFMKAQSTSIVLQFKKSPMKFNTQILVHWFSLWLTEVSQSKQPNCLVTECNQVSFLIMQNTLMSIVGL